MSNSFSKDKLLRPGKNVTITILQFQDTICSSAPKRHKLSVHVISTAPKPENQLETAEMPVEEQSSFHTSKV